VVRGPADAIEPVARAVGGSPLVKSALHGGDPNWGRILQAAGQALRNGSAEIDLAIEGLTVVQGGDDLPLTDAERKGLDNVMQAAEVDMELRLPGGDAATELYFCDLSEEYVSFNSEYTT
jgi:glutamate N-acetyltransferase/amino-acid N-acetyltransferase